MGIIKNCVRRQKIMLNYELIIEKMPHCVSAPEYATEGSAGMDLFAANDDNIILKSGSRDIVPTGIKMVLPEGTEAQIRSKSGTTFKLGLIVLNAPGTIDEDYRGELKVIVMNVSDKDIIINRGMKVAQMVIAPFVKASIKEVSNVQNDTKRGEGGFGSTGV